MPSANMPHLDRSVNNHSCLIAAAPCCHAAKFLPHATVLLLVSLRYNTFLTYNAECLALGDCCCIRQLPLVPHGAAPAADAACLYVSGCMSVFLCFSVRQPICISVCNSAYGCMPPVCLSGFACTHTCLYARLSVYIYVYMLVCLSVSVFTPVCLHSCPWLHARLSACL